MSLSHRVTEVLENVFFSNFNSFRVTNNKTNNKESTNLVTVDTTENGTTIVNANNDRIKILIQNQGIEPVLLSFGENTSITNYSLILAASSSIRIGDGGTYESCSWIDSIKGLTESGSSIVSIYEEVI